MIDVFVKSKQMTQNQRDMIHWGARYAVFEWQQREQQNAEMLKLLTSTGINNTTPEAQAEIAKATAQIEAGDFDLVEDLVD